ncbi:WGR domain-containing protein [Epibacterium ulvae]|uniref:WGR domain-containing protein n=1 Tax=Epibacterium ulvae TaxID=1156985 RepID=A0A1G5QY54_9RHOB|nr:WGR domain-containing protein [Epibacterium ulvae]SCZ66733.1 WGR domain-containing protein [Epibacterium ulvae]
MAICLLYAQSETTPARYYRIELAMNLFSEVSLLREWGHPGDDGHQVINLFDNLKEASLAADEHRDRMMERGYQRWHAHPNEH